MKDELIEIEVSNTAQDYSRVLWWFHLKKVIIIGALYLLVVTPMLWLTFFGAGADPFQNNNNSVLSVMILFAVLPVVIFGSIAFNIRKQSKNIEKTLEPTKFIFSGTGVETSSESTSTKASWDTFQKIQEIKEDFLFYPQKNIFYTIPKRSFLNDLQIEDFRSLVREKLGEKTKLNK